VVRLFNHRNIGGMMETPIRPFQECEISSPFTEDYLRLLRGMSYSFRSAIFRGQRNYDWKLVPSLYRHPNVNKPEQGSSRFDGIERGLLRRFFDESSMETAIQRTGTVRDLVLAQHYGVPTRLLDWSADPLVALYFAVEDHRSVADAAVYLIEPRSGRTVDYTDIPYNGSVSSIKPPVIDRRITAQRSVFTIQKYLYTEDGFQALDDRKILEDDPADIHKRSEVFALGKLRIPAKLKSSFLLELQSFGMDRSTIFPGLDGIGAAIRKDYMSTVYG